MQIGVKELLWAGFGFLRLFLSWLVLHQRKTYFKIYIKNNFINFMIPYRSYVRIFIWRQWVDVCLIFKKILSMFYFYCVCLCMSSTWIQLPARLGEDLSLLQLEFQTVMDCQMWNSPGSSAKTSNASERVFFSALEASYLSGR